MSQSLIGTRVPWAHLEEYLDTHQKGVTSMLDLLKLGVMDRADIETKLPKSFISLYQVITKILSANKIPLPAKEEEKESDFDKIQVMVKKFMRLQSVLVSQNSKNQEEIKYLIQQMKERISNNNNMSELPSKLSETASVIEKKFSQINKSLEKQQDLIIKAIKNNDKNTFEEVKKEQNAMISQDTYKIYTGGKPDQEKIKIGSDNHGALDLIPKKINLEDFFDDREVLGLRGRDKIQIIVKIQAIIRGVITRRRMKQRSGSQPKTMGRLSNEKFDGETNYDNKKVQEVRQKLGAFELNDTNAYQDGIKRKKLPKKTLENGAIYEGEWNEVSNQREGKGTQIWPDGSLYEGYWRNGRAYGKGRLIHADGDVYEGDWKNDKADGFGRYIKENEDGSHYEGFWKEDKQHGKGTEKWPDGNLYEGDYFEGKKHGNGILRFPDGSTYKEQFLEDVHGKGTYSWADRLKYEGEWKNNKMHGQGVFSWEGGRKWDGEWFNGKEHGEGLYTDSEGVRRGEWKDGKRIRWIEE